MMGRVLHVWEAAGPQRWGVRGDEVGVVGRSPTVTDSGALLGFSSSEPWDTREDLEELGAWKGRCDTILFGVHLLEGLVRQAWSEHRESGLVLLLGWMADHAQPCRPV